MTYQDEIINKLMCDYETAVINFENHPSLAHSQSLAKARQAIVRFLKEGI